MWFSNGEPTTTSSGADVGALADLGFSSASAPTRTTPRPQTHHGQKIPITVPASARVPVEHCLRTAPARAANLLRALLVLANLEVCR